MSRKPKSFVRWALVHNAELLDIIVDSGESAKSLQRPGMRDCSPWWTRQVQGVIVAKLDRLTRNVKDLCELLECFERRGVALISVAESLERRAPTRVRKRRRPGPKPSGRSVFTAGAVNPKILALPFAVY